MCASLSTGRVPSGVIGTRSQPAEQRCALVRLSPPEPRTAVLGLSERAGGASDKATTPEILLRGRRTRPNLVARARPVPAPSERRRAREGFIGPFGPNIAHCWSDPSPGTRRMAVGWKGETALAVQ